LITSAKGVMFRMHSQWISSRVSLREATLRMMAGAAPGKTQQLLHQSRPKAQTNRTILCGKGDPSICGGDWP
jgi:hypothetical protein